MGEILILLLAVSSSPAAADGALIPAGAIWTYHDSGADPGPGWQEPGFDDSGWAMGPAKLGFGEGDEATIVGLGGTTLPIAVYFRTTFEVDAPPLTGLTVHLKRDDGAVVFLNGVEVLRSNMPIGPIGPDTLAQSVVGGTEEETFVPFDVLPSALAPGTNTIAVEVHQANAQSSDLGFDLELVGQVSLPGEAEFIRGDVNGDEFVDLADPVCVLYALFAGGWADCFDAADADDNGDLDLADPIVILEYLFLDGEDPAAPFPWAAEDPTPDGIGCDRPGR